MAAAAVVSSCTRLSAARRSRDRSVRLKAAERSGSTDRLSDSDSDDEESKDAGGEEKDAADGGEEGGAAQAAAGGRKAARPKKISDYSLTIELLLAAGADLHRLNGCGETALAIAERCGHEVGAEVLRNAKLKGLKELCDHKLGKNANKIKGGSGGDGGGGEGNDEEADKAAAEKAAAAAAELEKELLLEVRGDYVAHTDCPS